jgi:nicotinamidase-related amidase
VWALSALNPACLESKTVTALFFTPPGSEPDVDPVLALSTYHALSVGTHTWHDTHHHTRTRHTTHIAPHTQRGRIGAFLVGDLEAAEELFEQTRHQLGGVFDTTHYDVANALCGIAFW